MTDHILGRCSRCSQLVKVYWLKTKAESGRLHEPDCYGCSPPTPMFRCEVLEVKPMEMPVGLLFQFDAKYGKEK